MLLFTICHFKISNINLTTLQLSWYQTHAHIAFCKN